MRAALLTAAGLTAALALAHALPSAHALPAAHALPSADARPGVALARQEAPAQERAAPPPARASFALEPDTVRVGEPFTLGLTVRAEPGWRVRFPEILGLAEGFEQRAAVETFEERPTTWRAYYRLVAWETPGGDLPPLELELATDGELHSVVVQPPPVHVRSVLPQDEQGLELRPARPFLERARFPWLPVLLAALALAALAWWARRRRARDGGAAPTSREAPADRALRELGELEARWQSGSLDAARFYDGLEGTLRRYAETTRGWPPGTLIGSLPNGDRELAGVLRRSALTRFGRLETRQAGPLGAIEVCRSWLEDERAEPGQAAERAEPGQADERVEPGQAAEGAQ